MGWMPTFGRLGISISKPSRLLMDGVLSVATKGIPLSIVCSEGGL
jgi:hypothetical protein